MNVTIGEYSGKIAGREAMRETSKQEQAINEIMTMEGVEDIHEEYYKVLNKESDLGANKRAEVIVRMDLYRRMAKIK